MKSKPTFVDVPPPDEVKVYARDIGRTGSKRLETFSAKRDSFTEGETFKSGGRTYVVERIAA